MYDGESNRGNGLGCGGRVFFLQGNRAVKLGVAAPMTKLTRDCGQCIALEHFDTGVIDSEDQVSAFSNYISVDND